MCVLLWPCGVAAQRYHTTDRMQGWHMHVLIGKPTRVSKPYLLPHVRILQALKRVHREQQVRDALLQCSGMHILALGILLDTICHVVTFLTARPRVVPVMAPAKAHSCRVLNAEQRVKLHCSATMQEPPRVLLQGGAPAAAACTPLAACAAQTPAGTGPSRAAPAAPLPPAAPCPPPRPPAQALHGKLIVLLSSPAQTHMQGNKSF